MIFKKFFIPLLFFIVSLTVHAQGQKNTNFLFGVHLGGNITRYYVPGYSFKPDLLPTLGAGASKRLFGNFGLNACVEYAHKGSNNTSPYRKIRTHSIDGILAGQYMITPGIKLEAGLQSTYMITGYVLTIDGSMPSGMRREMLGEEDFGYDCMFGLELSMTTAFDLRIRMNPDFASRNYSLQFTLNVRLNNLKFKTGYKKYYSMKEALEDPLTVKSLSLHRKSLDSLPDDIGKFLNLEELYLDGNKLTTLPDGIGNLVNLEKLSVKYNRLQRLPDAIGNLTHLKELHLVNNDLKELPDTLFAIRNLQYLYIGKNSLVSLSPLIGNLTALIELDIASCGPAVQVPGTITNLRQLEVLYYDDNVILPNNLFNANPRLKLRKKY